MNRREIIATLSQYNLRPAHGLGQNFLADDRTAGQIMTLAQLSRQDLVLEIGPGIGALTRELVRLAGRVIAVELDGSLLTALRAGLPPEGDCQVIQGDALAADLSTLTTGWAGPVKVVANLPYYITTPLIEKVICELPGSASLILMVQKEAAGRVLAGPGSKQYGPLAVLVASFGQAKRELVVPAAAFFPQPHVDSCVIRINSVSKLQIADWQKYRKFLERCFLHRRKTLDNSLKASGYATERLKWLQNYLVSLGLPANARAETLNPQHFIAIFQQIG